MTEYLKSTPVRPTSRQIEMQAQACIDFCLMKMQLQVAPLPIPVENWIEGVFGIQFGIGNLTKYGPKVLGAAFIPEREILISESITGQDGRFRFTSAHELGHFVLHGSLSRMFRDSTADPGSGELYEREADRFAAAFLMPSELVIRALFAICSDRKLDPCEFFVSLLNGSRQTLSLWKHTFLPAITRRFGVSLSTAVFRFREMSLPNGEPFVSAHQMASLFAATR